MKRSLIIIAAILIVCLTGCQALEMNRAIMEAADREVLKAHASNIAVGINAYNHMYPEDALPDDVTLEKVKETLEKEDFWPRSLDDETARMAWEFLVIKNGEAKVLKED